MTVELHQGDCLDVMREMDAGSVDAIITDPPYGIGYASSRKKRMSGEPRKNMPRFGKDEFNADWIPEAYRVLADDSPLYLFTRWDMIHEWSAALEAAGFVVAQRLIWDKTHWGMGDLRYYGSMTEDVLFCRKGAPVMNWEKRRGNIFRKDKLFLREGQFDHPTQKPEIVLGEFVRDCTRSGETVFDPFMGSGSTGAAAVRRYRGFVGIEIDAQFFEIARARIEMAQLAASQMRLDL